MTDLTRSAGVPRLDLPDFTEAGDAIRERLYGLARCLCEAVLVDNPCPKVEAMADRMLNPQVGDLGVVTDALYREVWWGGWQHGVGYLLAHRSEPVPEWDDLESPEGGPFSNPGEDVFYVQYGPDPEDVCRWVNAEFRSLTLSSQL